VAALVVGVAIAVVVLVLVTGRGGDDATDGSAAAQQRSSRSASVARAELPTIAKVRNARPQSNWGPYSGPVPILRYNVVGKPLPGEAFPELFVPPADFHAQLPELRRRGWPGVLVLDTEAPAPPAAAVARLIALGWDIEPSGRDPGAARRFVKAHFPAPAHNFAAPSPESSAPPIAAVKTAGFNGATTATGGGFAEASHPFKMPRITIFGLSGITGFEEAIRSRGQGVGA
jgi:hypothetical protein